MGSFGGAGFEDSHGASDFLEDDDEDLFDESGRSFFSTLQKIVSEGFKGGREQFSYVGWAMARFLNSSRCLSSSESMVINY